MIKLIVNCNIGFMLLHEFLQEFGHVIWMIHGLKLINLIERSERFAKH